MEVSTFAVFWRVGSYFTLSQSGAVLRRGHDTLGCGFLWLLLNMVGREFIHLPCHRPDADAARDRLHRGALHFGTQWTSEDVAWIMWGFARCFVHRGQWSALQGLALASVALHWEAPDAPVSFNQGIHFFFVTLQGGRRSYVATSAGGWVMYVLRFRGSTFARSFSNFDRAYDKETCEHASV